MKSGHCGKCFAMMLVATFAIFGSVVSAWGNYWSNTYTNQGITWKLGVSVEDWNGIDPEFPPHCYLRGISGQASVVSNLTIPAVVGWDSHGSAGIGNVQLTSIQSTAFSNYSAIYEVRLSDITKTVYVPAFRGCKNLRAIHALADWSRISPYWSTNGVLFRTNALVKYPEGKTGAYFEVPATVASLRAGCLAGTKLSAVRFLGDKPTCGNGVFDGSSFVGFCPESWGLAWGETWNGITMYPIPANGIKVVDGITNCYEVSGGKLWIAQLKNGAVTITGVVPPEGNLAIPSKLHKCPVTGIGDWAFQNCSGLTSVSIPDSVTNIGFNAFESCGNLASVTLGSGVQALDGGAFSGCSSLTDIQVAERNAAYTSEDGVVFSKDKSVLILCPGGKRGAYSIPDSVTDIGDNAFASCHKLTSVTLGSGVRKVDHWTFINCFSVVNFQVAEGNAAYTSEGGVLLSKDKRILILYPRGVYGEGSIPAGVEAIGEGAFFWCDLTSVVIPEGVTDIGERAFYGCDGLTSVDLPNTLTNIGPSAFSDCSGLTGVTIPDSVANIGQYAFDRCSGLTSAYIPAGVANIGVGAFQNCNNLSVITVSPDNARYSSHDGILCSKAGDILVCCPGGKSGAVEVPAGVKRIESKAFYGCGGLTTVTIPESVASIGRMAFWGCDGVMDMESIPGVFLLDGWVVGTDYTLSGPVELNGVRGIAEGGLNACDLTSVSIPASVAHIGDGAFTWCDDLTRLDVAADNPAYASVDGVLFTKDMKTLVSCPGGKRGAYEIPAGVERLAASAFAGCYWLEMETLPGSVGSIGANAFDSCDSVVRMVIPSSVTNIGSGAFEDCDALESVVFHGGVTRLEKYMFAWCPKLAEVLIGDGVAEIGDYAFRQCSALATLTIPESVASVGKDVFDGCSALKTLYVPTAWEGTDMLADAAVPAGCTVVYRGGSEESATQETPVPVAHSWLEEQAADILAANGGDYEAAAQAPAANGLPVWECYVAGLSTTEAEAEFKVKSFALVDGEVKIEWEPDLNGGGTPNARTYIVQGKPTMTNAWGVTNASSRFFRVLVKMQQ